MNVFGVSGFSRWRGIVTAVFIGLTTTGLRLSALANDVTLAWDPSTDPMVAGYNIYSGGASRTYTNLVDAGSATSATISNLVPGMTYYFAATTYTISGLESDYSAEATYTVPLGTNAVPNQPPTLDLIPNLTVNENAGPQTVDLSGISSGSPNQIQTLTVTAFSSDPSIIANPAITYTSPNPNGILDFSVAPNLFGAVTLTVMVDNGGAVSNTIIRSFMVTINPVNNPPTLDPLSNLAVNENGGSQTINLTGITSGATNEFQPLTVTASSSNPSVIPNPTVNYTSPNTTGTLTLVVPTNTIGSSQITVNVDDGQGFNNTIARTFTVSINPTTSGAGNLTNAFIAPNTAFRLLLSSPYNNGDKLSYSLVSGAPAGAKIATHRGVSYLTWTPTTGQSLTTNLITIALTDNSNSALNTNETVLITVLDYLSLSVGSTSVRAGQSATVPIYLSSSSGVTNLSFTVDWPPTRFTNPSLFISVPGVATSSVQVQSTNLLFNLQTAAGQVLQKSNLIAQLNFQTVSNQSSAFVNLVVRNINASKPDSSAYVNYVPSAGQVAVVSGKPLLAATLDINTNRVLTAFGNIGTTYQIQSSTNPALSNAWVPRSSYTQTNISQNLPVDPSNPLIFYRLLAP
jgi:hypothetical protein